MHTCACMQTGAQQRPSMCMAPHRRSRARRRARSPPTSTRRPPQPRPPTWARQLISPRLAISTLVTLPVVMVVLLLLERRLRREMLPGGRGVESGWRHVGRWRAAGWDGQLCNAAPLCAIQMLNACSDWNGRQAGLRGQGGGRHWQRRLAAGVTGASAASRPTLRGLSAGPCLTSQGLPAFAGRGAAQRPPPATLPPFLPQLVCWQPAPGVQRRDLIASGGPCRVPNAR